MSYGTYDNSSFFAAETSQRPRDPMETAKEAIENGPREMPFHVEGIIPKKSLVMLTGPPKAAGKTTLMLHISKALTEGTSFLGHPVDETGVVYLSEQARTLTTSEYLVPLGLDNENMHFVWPGKKAYYEGWSELVDAISYHISSKGAEVIIVDSFSYFAGLKGEEENMPGPTQNAVEKLQDIRDKKGTSVVIVHHDRKSGGDVHESARGSSVLPASSDLILNLTKADSNHPENARRLKTAGRLSDVASEQIICLTENGYERLDGVRGNLEDEIYDLLPTSSKEAITPSDVRSKLREQGWDGSEKTVRRRLKNMDDVRVVGEGHRGDPYRYYLSPPDDFAITDIGSPEN